MISARSPTETNVPAPYATDRQKMFDACVRPVRLVQAIPSDDEATVPKLPTAQNAAGPVAILARLRDVVSERFAHGEIPSAEAYTCPLPPNARNPAEP